PSQGPEEPRTKPRRGRTQNPEQAHPRQGREEPRTSQQQSRTQNPEQAHPSQGREEPRTSPRRSRTQNPAPHTLTATHLTVTYNGTPAPKDVDLTLTPGRITAVVGPNGAGKSTLLHCPPGTLRPD